MPGDYPAWGGFEHTYGYVEDVYEHGDGPQAEGLNHVQSYFDEDDYNYRGHSHDAGSSNYYWSDYTSGVAGAPGDVYGSYSYPQHQYRNGPSYGRQTYTARGSEYRDDGGEAAYFHSDYHDPTSNVQCYPDPNRFPIRGRQVVRAVPPAPSPPPTPRSPSPSYLSTSLLPSIHTEAPLRKLLILDLNGTLLFRSKPPFQPPLSRAATSRNNSMSASQPFRPVKRMAFARPYLACFREYLFHPSTKKWLDVMIWSSAQPHSVKDMLQQCFPVPKKPQDGDGEASSEQSGETDDRFIAVWARDTLGLSRVDYSRKSQTTKDLHKPWCQLVVPCSMGQPEESPEDKHATLRHSAHTTLLLDDSPLKAHLQPWNHVCLREYDAQARDEDAKEFMALLREKDGHTGKLHPEDVIQSPNLPGMLARHDSATPRFDATLLAVIGVLEGVKHESNVAGWIRAGGLWGETKKDKGAMIRIVEHEHRAEHISRDPLSVGGMKHSRGADDNGPCPSRPAKRARVKSLQSSALPSLAYPTGLSLDGTAGSPSPRPSAISSPPASGLATADPGPRNDNGDVPRGEGDETKAQKAESQTLWFTHPATFDYWVCQGRRVLRRLEIEEEHGVTVEEEYRVKAVPSV